MAIKIGERSIRRHAGSTATELPPWHTAHSKQPRRNNSIQSWREILIRSSSGLYMSVVLRSCWQHNEHSSLCLHASASSHDLPPSGDANPSLLAGLCWRLVLPGIARPSIGVAITPTAPSLVYHFLPCCCSHFLQFTVYFLIGGSQNLY